MSSVDASHPVHPGETVAGEVVAGGGLTPAMLRPILAPFEDAADAVLIAVEDADGAILASAGHEPGPSDASVEVVQEIRCGPGEALVGRVVGLGSGALVGPIVASLAASLAALASTSHVHQASGTAAHRLEAELALSRRIQRSFVPLTAPDLKGYEVASHYEAAREVGGDFFDVFSLRGRSSRAGIVIADVTGKGIAAALLMAFARPLIRAAVDHARDPIVALDRTNSILAEERRSALFITALCAMLDLRTGVLKLANAGHEPPLVVPADGGPIRWLTGSGPLLGAFPTLDLPDCSIRLDPGDLLLLYTDGVTDTKSASGERFGDDRLTAVVEDARRGSAQDVVDAVVGATRTFQGAMPAADDVTILAIRRNDRAAPRRPGTSRSVPRVPVPRVA